MVAVGNYSLLFGLETARRISDKNFNRLFLIKPEYFMDYAKYVYPFQWGQTLRANGPVFIDTFLKIFPGHPADQFITCGQIQEIRNYLLDNLRKAHVTIISGQPEPIKRLDDKSYRLTITAPVHYSIDFPQDTKFLNWYTEFRGHGYSKIPSISVTNIYRKPLESIEDNIIIMGDNLTTSWIVDHIAMSRENNPHKSSKIPTVYYIGTATAEKTLPRSISTANVNRDLVNLIKLTPEMLESQADGNNPEVLACNHDSVRVRIKMNNGTSIEGLLYVAAGLEPALRITSEVPASHKMEKPYFQYLIDRQKYQAKYIGTQENPAGSLLSALELWQALFYHDNYLYPLGAYYQEFNFPKEYLAMLALFTSDEMKSKKIKFFPDILRDYMLIFDIDLSPQFFLELGKKLGVELPYEHKLTRTPNPKQMIALCCEIFRSTHSPSAENLKKFEVAFEEMVKKIEKNAKISDHTKSLVGSLLTLLALAFAVNRA